MVHVPAVTARPAPPGETFPFHDALDKGSLLFRPEKPLMLSVSPGRTASSAALVEAVDLYATVSELAGLPVPSLCPNVSFHVAFCTEGVSLVPLIKQLAVTSFRDDAASASAAAATSAGGRNPTWKRAVFSQYPRPTAHPTLLNANRTHIRIMGYTMRTDQQRYTEWVGYDLPTFTADWSQVYARELYVYSSDPDEDVNVAEVGAFRALRQTLSRQLRAGWRQALPPGHGLGRDTE